MTNYEDALHEMRKIAEKNCTLPTATTEHPEATAVNNEAAAVNDQPCNADYGAASLREWFMSPAGVAAENDDPDLYEANVRLLRAAQRLLVEDLESSTPPATPLSPAPTPAPWPARRPVCVRCDDGTTQMFVADHQGDGRYIARGLPTNRGDFTFQVDELGVVSVQRPTAPPPAGAAPRTSGDGSTWLAPFITDAAAWSHGPAECGDGLRPCDGRHRLGLLVRQRASCVTEDLECYDGSCVEGYPGPSCGRPAVETRYGVPLCRKHAASAAAPPELPGDVSPERGEGIARLSLPPGSLTSRALDLASLADLLAEDAT